MKSVTAAFLAIISLTSTGAMAQTVASSFDGLSAALNLNFTTAGVDVSDTLGNSIGNVSTSDQNFVIQMAKGVSFGSNGVANFGASAHLGDMKSASVGPLQLKATGNYALYAELGYAFDRKSMAYAKLSVDHLTATVSGGGPGIDGSLNATGMGYGAGYRHTLSQGIYLQGEFMQVNYDNVVSAAGLVLKPSTTTALFGVGVKF